MGDRPWRSAPCSSGRILLDSIQRCRREPVIYRLDNKSVNIRSRLVAEDIRRCGRDEPDQLLRTMADQPAHRGLRAVSAWPFLMAYFRNRLVVLSREVSSVRSLRLRLETANGFQNGQ